MEPRVYRMLIFRQGGEQRLISFTPSTSCTLQEVLEQVCIPVTAYTNVQCIHKDQLIFENHEIEIDYFVAVGCTVSIEELLHLLLQKIADISTDAAQRHNRELPTNIVESRFECHKCGRLCRSRIGLYSHERSCLTYIRSLNHLIRWIRPDIYSTDDDE